MKKGGKPKRKRKEERQKGKERRKDGKESREKYTTVGRKAERKEANRKHNIEE
jgi:hypothetical protein